MSARYHWASAVSGDFSTAADWTHGLVPTSSSNTFLTVAGAAYTVTVDSTHAVRNLTIASNATLAIAGATFDSSAVTTAGQIAIGDGGNYRVHGAVNNTGVIALNSVALVAKLVINASNVVFSGGGSIVMSDAANNLIAGGAAADILTNSNNTISGAGKLGNGQLTLVNQAGGVIDATGAVNALTVDTAGHPLTNAGLMEATGAAGLVIQSTTINNAGGTVFAGAGSKVTLALSTINAGAGTSALNTAATGLITVGNHSIAQVQGTLANAGTIALASTGAIADLRIAAGGATLTGGGTVTLSGPFGRILGASTTATLTNVDNTISGRGFIGLKSMTLVNEAAGVIDAKGGNLVVSTAGSTLINAGLMEATNAGLLVIASTTVDQTAGGTILAASGAHVDLQDVDIIGGAVGSAGTGAVNVNASGGALDGTVSTVSVTGTVGIGPGRDLTIEGAIHNAGKIVVAATLGNPTQTNLIVGAAGATLTGGGLIHLSSLPENSILGVSSSATLTNVDNHIFGGGTIGAGTMTLINDAAGTIVGNTAAGLTIDTGANAILNAGLIAANNAVGGVTVASAVTNNGRLFAAGGTLTLEAAVTGTGTAAINGGRLDFVSTFNQNVSFNGATGVLELDQSQAYTTGKVGGLSHTGTSSLDLGDITFAAGTTTANYVGAKSGGVLTVTDGTHTANIHLSGDYTGAVFVTSSDGHGGTTVIDPTAAKQQTFVAAMASFGPHAVAASSTPLGHQPAHLALVVAPRAHFA